MRLEALRLPVGTAGGAAADAPGFGWAAFAAFLGALLIRIGCGCFDGSPSVGGPQIGE